MECLITRLKGSVNENLPKLGVLRLKIPASMFNEKVESYNYCTTLVTSSDRNVSGYSGECEAEVDNGAFFYCGGVNLGSKANITNYTNSDAANLMIVNPNNKDIIITYNNKYYSPTVKGYIVDTFDNVESIKYLLSNTVWVYGLDGQNFNGLNNPAYLKTLRIIGCTIEDNALDGANSLETVRGNINSGATLPANVKSYAGTISKWSIGDRASGNMLDMNDNATFMDTDSINNMLIDMAKCTGRSGLRMNVLCNTEYTPSEDALAAIQTLKSYYTRIYLYNKDYVGL